ncbi:hypothetical protein BC826DRAFT_970614 [Russula brevipes]|nr:hypothetical protein BC826DRAFT_970614 [Russula brevipes]
MAELVFDAPTLSAPGMTGITYLAGSTAAVGQAVWNGAWISPWTTPPRSWTGDIPGVERHGGYHLENWLVQFSPESCQALRPEASDATPADRRRGFSESSLWTTAMYQDVGLAILDPPFQLQTGQLVVTPPAASFRSRGCRLPVKSASGESLTAVRLGLPINGGVALSGNASLVKRRHYDAAA